ncbi:MAG: penicillin acylase family protein [Lysobacterales bacterium]
MRTLRRLLLVLVIAALVAAVGGWLALRGSLPEYEGTRALPGLRASVTVTRDALGTATVQASDRHDLTFALGFVHAQERFFEMDTMRRSATGELSELFGPLTLKLDRKAREHRMRARAQAELAGLPKPERDELDTYRDGVNAGLAALAVRPFPYLLTGTAPAPWRSEDTLLVVAAMAFTLNDAGNKRELAFAQMHAALPLSAYRFLTAKGGPWDTPLAGPPLELPPLPPAGDIDLRTVPAALEPHESDDPDVPGSNSFAVAGALAGGAALLANDMHLDLGVPNIWFRARLVYPDPRHPGTDIGVSGASLPGTPVIVVGSNGRVAWGFTNSYADTMDWVRVETDPTDPDRYRTPEGWRTITHHTETIHVRGAPDDTLDVSDTEWGPILAKDVDGTPLALAWTAQQPGFANLVLQQLETATSADEAVAIAQRAGMPAQNFLVADRAGGIEWTIAGRLPLRTGDQDAELPADWSRPGTGWNGWLAPPAYPLIANPPSQRLWTANQRITEPPWLDVLGDGGYDLGARARQIRDDLAVRNAFDPAAMLAIELDDRALLLTQWKDRLAKVVAAMPASAERDRMTAALSDWSGRASIDSVAYRFVRAWRNEMIDRVLDAFAAAVRVKFPDFAFPKMSQAGQLVWKILVEQPPNLLPPGATDWDSLAADAAIAVAGKLEAQPGGIAQQTWGERNTTRIRHPLSRALPTFVGHWLDMPAQQLPGDRDMPRVQTPDFGASERFAVAPGDEAHGYFMMPGGQSGHPLSPYYGAGHADWAAGRPTPFLPGPAQHTLALTPASASR